MGCGASTAGVKYVEDEEGMHVPSLGVSRIAPMEDVTPPGSPSVAGSDGVETRGGREVKLTTQWDQLSPLLPLRSLRQVAAAGQVRGRQAWEEALPGAVLVLRLHGFRSLCADTLASPGALSPESSAVRAQRLSYLLDDLFHRLVQTVRALEGNVVQFTGDTVVCCFSADTPTGGSGRGGGKEDEIRGDADSQCVAACKCSLQLRQQVAAWAKRRAIGGANCLRLRCTCAIGVGEVSWVHLNAPPSRTSQAHFRSVLLRGSAVDEANRGVAVALVASQAGRGADDGVSIISDAVWKIACDTFVTESLDSAEAPHGVAGHRKLLRELPSGVTTADTKHAERNGLKPPSAVEAGLAEDSHTHDSLSVENSHKHLLPYLTIARQRSGTPPELRPLIVMAFRIEIFSSSSPDSLTRVQMSTAQLNRFYGLVTECVNGANGVLHHHALGHLHFEDHDVRTAPAWADAGAGIAAAAAAAPTHWCGLAVFGLTAVELDLLRCVRCAIRLAHALESVPLLMQNCRAAGGETAGAGSTTSTRVCGDMESELFCRSSLTLECGPLWLGRLGHRHRYQICVLGEAASRASDEADRHHVLTGTGGMWSKTTGSTTESDDDSTPRARQTSGGDTTSCGLACVENDVDVSATSPEQAKGAAGDGRHRSRCKSVCHVHVDDDMKEQLQQQQNDANSSSDLDRPLETVGVAPSDTLRFVRCNVPSSDDRPTPTGPSQMVGSAARWRLLP